MRRYQLTELASAHEREEPIVTNEDEAKRLGLALMIENFGPKSSAWLVKQHRRQLKTKGAFRFEAWRKQKIPDWFFYAIGFLRKRPGWEVVETWERKGLLRVFTLKWKLRGTWRALVLEMRSPS